MKQRIISGMVMACLLIFVFIGGYLITMAGFVIAILGMREFFKGFKAMDVHPSYPLAVISIILLYAINVTGKILILKPEVTNSLYMFWLFISVLMSLLYLFKIEERKLADSMATITGIFYIGFFSYHAVLLEDVFSGKCYFSPVLLALSTAFGTDIMAYFGGYFLGKHKLCPSISPKKTIEGSISGILGSIILTTLIGYFLIDRENLIWFIIIGLAGGIISQFGDLTASIFKRKMGIKDYGHLIPGHGGIMDRFDSVLLTAPMVYYMLKIVYI